MINVEDLTITEIGQFPGNNSPVITFKMNGRTFLLHIHLEGDLYRPTGIQHINIPKEEGKCQFCGTANELPNFCRTFEDQETLNALFHRVIEDNSIRLHWLYLPHI